MFTVQECKFQAITMKKKIKSTEKKKFALNRQEYLNNVQVVNKEIF